jgi:peroxiredoxin
MPRRIIVCLGCCALALAACGDDSTQKSAGNGSPPPAGGPPGYGGSGSPYGGGQPGGAQIEFNDNAATNASTDVPLSEMKFTDVDGNAKQLKDLGEKNLVVVVVRGMQVQGVVCPYCATQTSRLIKSYQEFKDREAEVVVIYPLAAGRNKQELDTFLTRSKQAINEPGAETPFPVWLDVDLHAVDVLGLRADLAKPTTYILDKQGRIRFAHVGSMTDRPSIKVMLAQLDALK